MRRAKKKQCDGCFRNQKGGDRIGKTRSGDGTHPKENGNGRYRRIWEIQGEMGGDREAIYIGGDEKRKNQEVE